MNRRDVFAAGAALALGAPLAAEAAERTAGQDGPRMMSSADFGARGDGRHDDTAALQAALDAAFAPGGPGFLLIPPGRYRISRTLRLDFPGPSANVTRHSGISAHGVRIDSAITDGGHVLELISRGTVRFLLIEGLDIKGSGRDGNGIHLECQRHGHYLYNICLRDVVVQGCGGDGCRMIGNVFEGQVINSYFRDNRGNGATFAHGRPGGILSAIHVFGSVFGGNGEFGVAMINNCYDVSYHGCYFLLNGRHGLLAENGCTLLSNCGFENNHQKAKRFADGGAGIRLLVFGTLIGCTAYSIYSQTHLIDAFVTNQLVMIGCTGSGGGDAKKAGLARLQGNAGDCRATVVGCSGAVQYVGGIEGLEIGNGGPGVQFGSRWNSRNLPALGDYRLWVDGDGRLRIKHGEPGSDRDGRPVGA